jgi:glutathione synthase/RimK-type ligase-like ATP-grasp enzyme
VVAEEVFACQVTSAADDYRYSSLQGARVEIRPFELSTELRDCCRSLAAALGLLVAGIDLRRTQQGKWYCFEVNPSPGFTYYEEATGQPIAQAIARLLMKPATTGAAAHHSADKRS